MSHADEPRPGARTARQCTVASSRGEKSPGGTWDKEEQPNGPAEAPLTHPRLPNIRIASRVKHRNDLNLACSNFVEYYERKAANDSSSQTAINDGKQQRIGPNLRE